MSETSGLLESLKSLLWFLLPITFPYFLYRYLHMLTGNSNTSLKYSNLRGRVVLITGASSGLGEALAHAFYRVGCKLILASRREQELERVRQSLLQSAEVKQWRVATIGGEYPPVVVPLDLSDVDSVPKQTEKMTGIFGHIDILINNAGISMRGSVLDTSVDVDVAVMTVNYFGQVALTKALLPGMIRRKRGHIVAISSIQGLIGIPHRSSYAASKHALQGFCDSLRAEVAHHGVYVTVISPGYIRTRLSENALTGSGDVHGVMDKSTAEGYLPEEVASQVLSSVINQEKEKIISPLQPRVAIWLRFLAPFIYFNLMENRAKVNEQQKDH